MHFCALLLLLLLLLPRSRRRAVTVAVASASVPGIACGAWRKNQSQYRTCLGISLGVGQSG